MAFWSRTSDGSLINFDNVVKWFQDGSKLRAIHVNGQSTDFVFSSAALASAALNNLASMVGVTSGERALFSFNPTSGTGAIVGVLVGQGFQLDVVGGVFMGAVAIDAFVCTVTYLGPNALRVNYAGVGPSATPRDIAYFDKDSVAYLLYDAYAES